MGDLWVLLALGLLFMMLWMLILWVWQWKRRASGMEHVGWSSGLLVLALLYAVKADGYGPRRFLIAALVGLSSGFLARRSWAMGEPAEPAGFRGLWVFEGRAIQAVFLSLPVALLAIDPLPGLTVYEWAGLLIWTVGMAGQIFAETRRSFYEWLIWVAYFVAALSTPYGPWTILCPLLMLPRLKRPLDDAQ